MTSPTPQGGAATKNGQAVAAAPYPFPVGVYESGTQDYDQSQSMAATPVQMPLWNLSPTGWLKGLFFDFTFTTSGNSASAAFRADSTNGGFSGIQKVILYDLGGEVVISLAGYEWLVIQKFGGYFEAGDPRADLTFSQTAGTGATGGSAHIIMYLPFEVVARDGLGTVQNESKPGWKVEVWIDSTGQTYSTAPTTAPTCRLRGYADSYTEPAAAAPNGRAFAQTPPLPGSLQYWKSENDGLSAGTSKYDLTNGIGFPIRNIIFYGRDASDSTRATADGNWPDPSTLLLGNINYFTRSKNLWISKMAKDYGLTSTTADAANGRENGVYPVWFTKDFGLKPGAELRFKYLDTQVNSLVRFTGSFGGAMNFFALVNWIATPSKNRYALISGSR